MNTPTREDRDWETEQNVHFKAFDLCLRARELGMTREDTEAAFRDQWERTEQIAAAKARAKESFPDDADDAAGGG